MRTQHCDITGVGVRRARLGVQVVTVVPDHDQPDIVDRRPHRRAGSDDGPHVTATYREEPSIPLGRPKVSGQ
jgi:hypothetical protein